MSCSVCEIRPCTVLMIFLWDKTLQCPACMEDNNNVGSKDNYESKNVAREQGWCYSEECCVSSFVKRTSEISVVHKELHRPSGTPSSIGMQTAGQRAHRQDFSIRVSSGCQQAVSPPSPLVSYPKRCFLHCASPSCLATALRSASSPAAGRAACAAAPAPFASCR